MLNSSCWRLSFMKLISSLHWIFFIHTTWIIVWLNKTFMKRTRKKKMGISMQILKFVWDKESKESYRISSYVISKADCFLEWAKYIMWCFWLDFRHSIMNEYSISYCSKLFKRKWNCYIQFFRYKEVCHKCVRWMLAMIICITKFIIE